MGELDGKVAIVTGAGRGIGEQVARKLSAAGARVLLSDLDGDAVAAVAAALPGPAAVRAGDLTAAGEPDAVVAAAVAAWGRLDIVVNNAGYAWDGPIHKVSDEQFQAMLDIHTVVPFRILRAAAPHLREPAKREAATGAEVFRKVVNVVSLAGVMGNAGQVAYASAKGGAVGLTRALAKEWGPLKINVNAVAFGFIDTRLTAAAGEAGAIEAAGRTIALGIPAAARAGAEAATALGRSATADEAARGIYFLCSPGSDYVHGQVLNVSGGLQLGMAG
ncbi:SDR family NAD(P)-dependent oxidoreductase [Patulibacter defluvii]|uniref:SDR family NAD(P)-dependent oxidoreductase n=1 Tax=Patulibacter defluvii TaxID=3095358 RepID=UPI002A7597CF|nr:SDR family oxidoreductase [Patulibacter sp. DM4]